MGWFTARPAAALLFAWAEWLERHRPDVGHLMVWRTVVFEDYDGFSDGL